MFGLNKEKPTGMSSHEVLREAEKRRVAGRMELKANYQLVPFDRFMEDAENFFRDKFREEQLRNQQNQNLKKTAVN